jgi:hypothetical protein|tara:strand:+ start:842 stop:1063 length:222 start_codon:yes stop_codon:yes gene_type:complete
MLKIANQLFEDAEREDGFNKAELLEACLSAMTEDQIYRMAINEGFVAVDHKGIDYDKSTPERIIDAVLARHGE